MGASRIESEYNEITSRDGWQLAFQVNFRMDILHNLLENLIGRRFGVNANATTIEANEKKKYDNSKQ